MANGRNKYQSRENRARVRALFFQEWDPIGVNAFAEAIDEYDAYADAAYVMLMEHGSSENELSAFLIDIATSHMGLSLTPDLVDASEKTVRALVQMKPSLTLQ